MLVAKAVEQELPLDGSHKITAQAQKRKLEKFISALDNSSNLQVVSPAYQWAQSPSTLYLDIKFSHRLDSPGCLEVSNPEVLLTDTKLSFIANCARSTQRIKLVLEVDFYSEINAEESSYSFTSVGRLNVNLKKREESAWPKPMKGKKPNNVHTWWEMKEKYQKVMNKFTGEEDEEDEGKSRLKKSPEGMLNNENKQNKEEL